MHPTAAPPTTTDEAIAVAEGLVGLLAAEAAAAEEARALTPPVLDAVAASGLFALVAPRSRGGGGAGLAPLVQSTRVLAHGCAAQAWTLSFFVLHNWLLSRFPETAQDEVWATRPYALVPAPLAPSGKLVAVDGGWELSGRWEWATGSPHADWVMVHALHDVDGGGLGLRFALLPAAEVTVEDVWHTSGMRATGSNAVRVRGAFVPHHRTIDAEALLTGTGDRADSDLADHPVMAVLALVAAAPALGAAEAVVALYEQRVRERVLAYTFGDKAAEQPAAQIRLATGMADVAAARALFDTTVRNLDAAAGQATVEQRMAVRLAAATVVRLSRGVIGHLCAGAGASVYATANPLQRFQRDVDVLQGHVVFDWDRTAELAGRIALGLELRPTDRV